MTPQHSTGVAPAVVSRALGALRKGVKGGYHVAGPALGRVAGSVTGITPSSGRIVLTFDDGPGGRWTRPLLDVLDRHGATATFFMLGTSVRRHPDIAREVAERGGEIALHGLDHRRTTALPPDVFAANLTEGVRVVEEATGRTIRWFRPPYGAQTPHTYRFTRRARLTPVMWTGTVWDWRDLPQEERVAKALESTVAGGIVLAHDHHAGPADGVDDGPDSGVDRVELLDRVLTAFAERGLRAVSLENALAEGAQLVRRPWFPRRPPIHDNH